MRQQFEQKEFKIGDFTDEELKNMSGIYQIRNIVNNKFYIGSAENFHKRRREHFNDLEKNKHCNNHLQDSYNLYGKENFIFEIIKITKPDKRKIIEQTYLDKYFGEEYFYNESPIANGGPNKYKEGQTPWNKGKECPQLSGENNGFYGKKHTEDFKKFIAEKNKGKSLYITDLDFNILKYYDYVSLVQYDNLPRSSIEKTVRGIGSELKKFHYYEGRFVFHTDDYNKLTNEDKMYYKQNVLYLLNKDKIIDIETGIIYKNKLQCSKSIKISYDTIGHHCKNKVKNPRFMYYTDYLKSLDNDTNI